MLPLVRSTDAVGPSSVVDRANGALIGGLIGAVIGKLLPAEKRSA